MNNIYRDAEQSLWKKRLIKKKIVREGILYIFVFFSFYLCFRSILTVPWIELGGTVRIYCEKTGYNATVEFITKPFYGGKKHRISSEVFSPHEKKPFLTINGEWNGVMEAKWADGVCCSFLIIFNASSLINLVLYN